MMCVYLTMRCNKVYLSNNEASCHHNCFRSIHPNKYFQKFSKEVWTPNKQINKED